MTITNILLTNDDGYDAAGLRAAYEALRPLGRVRVVAPKSERSACSHAITLRRPIAVEEIEHDLFGTVFAADAAPADCVRLAVAELIDEPIDLVVGGINHGANLGVDTYYSGTLAATREAAMLGLPAVAVSQALRGDVDPDWAAAREITAHVVAALLAEPLPGPGFWSVNLPAPIPADARDRIQRVPTASDPAPLVFHREKGGDRRVTVFRYGASYWQREVAGPCDYSVIRDGGIAVTSIPVFGTF